MAFRSTKAFAGALALVLPGLAQSGLLDAPPPSFPGGAPAIVVYRMGPVHYKPGHVDTVVKCESIDDTRMQLAVEIFDESDTRVGEVARAVLAPGESISFVTAADAASQGRVVLQGLPPVDHGKARVSATTAKLSCTAYNRIVGGDGSTTESVLELIKKVAR
jgi:hypothetical protein